MQSPGKIKLMVMLGGKQNKEPLIVDSIITMDLIGNTGLHPVLHQLYA